MSKYSGDTTQIMRDLLVAWKCFPDERPLDVLRELKRERGDGWRVP